MRSEAGSGLGAVGVVVGSEALVRLCAGRDEEVGGARVRRRAASEAGNAVSPASMRYAGDFALPLRSRLVLAGGALSCFLRSPPRRFSEDSAGSSEKVVMDESPLLIPSMVWSSFAIALLALHAPVTYQKRNTNTRQSQCGLDSSKMFRSPVPPFAFPPRPPDWRALRGPWRRKGAVRYALAP